MGLTMKEKTGSNEAIGVQLQTSKKEKGKIFDMGIGLAGYDRSYAPWG